MTIRMVACEPEKKPEEKLVLETISAVTDFLDGWFEVIGLGKQLILYCNEYPRNLPFNRMVRGRPIFGNLLVSKFGFDGIRLNLSDEEFDSIVKELSVTTSNDTN